MKSRRLFLVNAAALIFAQTAASQSPRAWRIGYLSVFSSEDDPEVFTVFRDGLRMLGYAEGSTIVIERRLASGVEALPNLAKELVAERMDVIVAISTPAAQAAKAASGSIPIVFVGASDPVGSALVTNLVHPGANITGLTDQGVDLTAKRLDLLTQVVPRLRGVAILGAPADPVWKPAWLELQSAAQKLKIVLIPVLDERPAQWQKLLAEVRSRVQAMYVAPQAVFATHYREVLELAARNKLPTIYEAYWYVRAGGLISYGADYASLTRGAARHVDKILRGTPVGEIPVEHTREFRLAINLNTANTLGLTIPGSLLQAAGEVYQ